MYFIGDLLSDYQNLMVGMSDTPPCYTVIHFSRFIEMMWKTQKIKAVSRVFILRRRTATESCLLFGSD